MKRTLKGTVPFVVMFIVAVGSVVVSCVTSSIDARGLDALSVNLGPDQDGRFFTVQTFDVIERIIVIDGADRSRRWEIPANEWEYDADTTELRLSGPLPTDEPILHVEGRTGRPHRFVLGSAGGTVEDLLVVLDGRLAIEGYDYRWNADEQTLVFQQDLDLTEAEYMIRYWTPQGSGGIGNWDGSDRDRMAYIEAHHRVGALRRQLDEGGAFWFLTPGEGAAAVPQLTRRAPTAEERRTMTAAAAAVRKPRFAVDDDQLSREVGFDARAPREVPIAGTDDPLTADGRYVVENAVDGALVRSVELFYRAPDQRGALVVSIHDAQYRPADDEDPRFVQSRDTLQLGLPVERVVMWGTRVSDPSQAPEVIPIAVYRWRDDRASFSLTVGLDRSREAETVIRQIVAYRG